MAQNKRTFSDQANCYAFAVKRPYPGGKGTAKPGGAVPGGGVDSYYERLKQGVLTDGGNKVRFISEHAVLAVTGTDVPAAQANWYLIALLVNADGFHFVRRQRKKAIGDPFWKWKQGNGGSEERNAYDATSKTWVDVTNARFPALVKGQLMTDPPGYAGWIRLAFFEVHNDGFDVTAS